MCEKVQVVLARQKQMYSRAGLQFTFVKCFGTQLSAFCSKPNLILLCSNQKQRIAWRRRARSELSCASRACAACPPRREVPPGGGWWRGRRDYHQLLTQQQNTGLWFVKQFQRHKSRRVRLKLLGLFLCIVWLERLSFFSTTGQAIDIGRRARAKFLLLTHFSQRYAKVPYLNEEFPDNVSIAFDNMRVRLCISVIGGDKRFDHKSTELNLSVPMSQWAKAPLEWKFQHW